MSRTSSETTVNKFSWAMVQMIRATADRDDDHEWIIDFLRNSEKYYWSYSPCFRSTILMDKHVVWGTEFIVFFSTLITHSDSVPWQLKLSAVRFWTYLTNCVVI